jgi:3-deoxy-manno-octulosonate cytidylyltransferase (CMP-KDO synthetase)
MKIISMIPARYSASRFPRKHMHGLEGKMLIDFSILPMQFIEASEKYRMHSLPRIRKKMVETSVECVEIDTPEDLERAKRLWK